MFASLSISVVLEKNLKVPLLTLYLNQFFLFQLCLISQRRKKALLETPYIMYTSCIKYNSLCNCKKLGTNKELKSRIYTVFNRTFFQWLFSFNFLRYILNHQNSKFPFQSKLMMKKLLKITEIVMLTKNS